MRTRLARPLLVAAILAILVAVTFGRLPGEAKLWGILQNSGHAPAFCLLSIAVLRLLTGPDHPAAAYSAGRYLASFVICLTAGVVIEGVQFLSGRDMSVTDIGNDILGSLCGLAGHAWLEHRQKGNPGTQAGLLVVCIGAAAASVAPLAWSIAAYWNRNAQFPVLADFDSPLDRYFLSAHGIDARVTLAGTTDNALRITIDPQRPGEYPGVAFYETAPDWSGHETLVIDLANPGKWPLKLTLRVHDRNHNQQFADRYNETFVIAPRETCLIRVPTRKIRFAPAGRQMDISQIAGVILFGDPSLAGRQFDLRGIWLE